MTDTLELNPIYEERVVAFVDILGFSSMVQKSEKDIKKTIEIRAALYEIENYKKINKDNRYDEMGSEVTIFSDSIVISRSTEWKYGDVFHTILDMLHLQMELLSKGILLRGGITVGKLYHKNNIVFGPAMIKAYKMESQEAIYPRIIVDENLYERARKNCPEQNTEEMEVKYIEDLLYTDIEDGYKFINYIECGSEFDNGEDFFHYLLEAQKIIKKGLEDSSEKVLPKFEWMKKYFNSLIKPDSGMNEWLIK